MLLLLAVAGCGGGGGGGSDPAAAACRRQAYQDQDVKDLIMLSNTGLQQVRGPALIQLNALLSQKVRACLAAQGLGPPGGVEPVKPY
jgi:hypothetical protein